MSCVFRCIIVLITSHNEIIVVDYGQVIIQYFVETMYNIT